MGYKVKFVLNILVRWGYLVGIDVMWVGDLNSLFSDNDIDVILCLCGGLGVVCILFLFDYVMICNNFKLLMGYLDIIVLYNVLFLKVGLISFYGFNVLSDWNLFYVV